MNRIIRLFVAICTVVAAALQPTVAAEPHAAGVTESRMFKVDPAAFIEGLKATGGTPDKDVSINARNFFAGIGVDLTAPGRSIAFDERLGMLTVKATAAEVDTIERTVQALNQTAPQIHLKARFIEMPKKLLATATFFTNAVAGRMTGIMSDSNFRGLLRALQQHDDVETLAEPEVVTTSGRQTQMSIDDWSSNLPLLAENGTQSHVSPQLSTPQPVKTKDRLSIDLVPYVLADGHTINLTAIPEIGNSAPKTISVNLWDNQTFIIGNLPRVLTDKNTDRQLLVFVTATIVDTAGNRVHADDDQPSSIPPQP